MKHIITLAIFTAVASAEYKAASPVVKVTTPAYGVAPTSTKKETGTVLPASIIPTPSCTESAKVAPTSVVPAYGKDSGKVAPTSVAPSYSKDSGKVAPTSVAPAYGYETKKEEPKKVAGAYDDVEDCEDDEPEVQNGYKSVAQPASGPAAATPAAAPTVAADNTPIVESPKDRGYTDTSVSGAGSVAAGLTVFAAQAFGLLL